MHERAPESLRRHSGYCDLATPRFATDYTFNHTSVDATREGTSDHAQLLKPGT